MAYGFENDKSKVDVYSKTESDDLALKVAYFHVATNKVIQPTNMVDTLTFVPDESLADKEIVAIADAKAMGVYSAGVNSVIASVEIMSCLLESSGNITATVGNKTNVPLTVEGGSQHNAGTYVLCLVK